MEPRASRHPHPDVDRTKGRAQPSSTNDLTIQFSPVPDTFIGRIVGSRIVIFAMFGAAGCTACGGCARSAPPAAGASSAVAQAATSCVVAFDSLEAIIRNDYPGYAEKARGRERSLAALADSVRAIARSSADFRVCIPAMQRWIHYFRDPHLMLWQSAPPASASATTPAAGSAAVPEVPAADPDRPTLRTIDDSTYLVRIPSLDRSYKGALDSLVAAHRDKLLSTPYLVLDLRGDGGGCTCTYSALVPLLYGGPFRELGYDLWTSPADVAFLRDALTDGTMPDSSKSEIRRVLPQLEATPNAFVPFPGDTVVRLDTVYPMPRTVAVLVDHGCASSCEDFVLMARESRKVTIVGAERTAGVHDYGNVRAVWLPGWRRLRIPTTRSHGLPGGAIDNVGLAPGVWVPAGVDDAVRFARSAASRPH